MKRLLRPMIERVFRRLPVSRAAYAQCDALRTRVAELEALVAPDDVAVQQHFGATAQVERLDPARLEDQVPQHRSMEDRTQMTLRCRDVAVLPRLPHAGTVEQQADGSAVQFMHNGIRVIAGGYGGLWLQDLITRSRGHHEPQDEVLFAELLKCLGADATMIELGGAWSYYSIWFLTEGRRRRAVVVEPDPQLLEVGRANARLNKCEPLFVNARAAGQSASPAPFATESSGTVELPAVSVADLVTQHGIQRLDLLHCDAQGIELEVLRSCRPLAAAGRLNWVMLATHAHQISGDPLTHQRCLALLRQMGATVLAEFDVHESFSGDGCIVAKFGPVPARWQTPRLSYNRYSQSFFRNPLYDLAAARKPADTTPTTLLAGSTHLALRGGLVAITADCSLGRAGDTIALPFDRAMFPAIVADSGWALDTLEFVQRRADPARRYVVLDIGANVGLFTRQLALRLPNIVRFQCVEAEAGNFQALQYNVAQLLGERGKLWHLALAERDGAMRLFRDAGNFGNFSLNEDAMRGQRFDTVTVPTAATDRWMHENVRLADDERLIWKSDTQGNDELIISLTPMAIWQRIDIAVVELWRIRKPAFDRTALRERLDAFPHKSIGIGTHHSTTDILDFLASDDWRFEDLYMWR